MATHSAKTASPGRRTFLKQSVMVALDLCRLAAVTGADMLFRARRRTRQHGRNFHAGARALPSVFIREAFL